MKPIVNKENIEVRCDRCGEILEFEVEKGFRIRVKPCKNCSKESFNEGVNSEREAYKAYKVPFN